jgi:hypothetical protein
VYGANPNPNPNSNPNPNPNPAPELWGVMGWDGWVYGACSLPWILPSNLDSAMVDVSERVDVVQNW